MEKPGFAIQTYKGHAFDPKTMTINKVDINDISHALSNLCRYVGHCKVFYSVAEHSVLTYEIAKELWSDELDVQYAALMHDATEAYVGDVPTPLKVLLPEFNAIEEKIAKAIGKEYDVKWNKNIHEKVKMVDKYALATEAPKLFDDVSHWTTIKALPTFNHLLCEFIDGQFYPLKPVKAQVQFLQAFTEIRRNIKDEQKSTK